MAQALPVPGVLRVVSNAPWMRSRRRRTRARALTLDQPTCRTCGYIRHAVRHDEAPPQQPGRLERADARRHARVQRRLRRRKLAEIKKFGGSEVYAASSPSKCRGATSLLRDVYLSAERPGRSTRRPTRDVPPKSWTASAAGAGRDRHACAGRPAATRRRARPHERLMEQARQAAKKKGHQAGQDRRGQDRRDPRRGRLLQGLAEFLVDLPLFPFACIKGPTVKIVPSRYLAG
jgi:hypothetical protein